jgi:hypothetical protein
MQIDENYVNDEQPENTSPSIRESLEPGSNVTIERRLSLSKQQLPSASTSFGIMTSLTLGKQNSIDI